MFLQTVRPEVMRDSLLQRQEKDRLGRKFSGFARSSFPYNLYENESDNKDILSSGMLHRVDLQLLADNSGQIFRRIFKSQAVQ